MGKNMGKSLHPKTHKPSYLMNNKLRSTIQTTLMLSRSPIFDELW